MKATDRELEKLLKKHDIHRLDRVKDFFVAIQGLRLDWDGTLRRLEINRQNTLRSLRGKQMPISVTIKHTKRSAGLKVTHPVLLGVIQKALERYIEENEPKETDRAISSVRSPIKSKLVELVARLDRFLNYKGVRFKSQEEALDFYSQFVDLAQPNAINDSKKFLRNRIVSRKKIVSKRSPNKP